VQVRRSDQFPGFLYKSIGFLAKRCDSTHVHRLTPPHRIWYQEIAPGLLKVFPGKPIVDEFMHVLQISTTETMLLYISLNVSGLPLAQTKLLQTRKTDVPGQWRERPAKFCSLFYYVDCNFKDRFAALVKNPKSLLPDRNALLMSSAQRLTSLA
jgi:hypothetical protein